MSTRASVEGVPETAAIDAVLFDSAAVDATEWPSDCDLCRMYVIETSHGERPFAGSPFLPRSEAREWLAKELRRIVAAGRISEAAVDVVVLEHDLTMHRLPKQVVAEVTKEVLAALADADRSSEDGWDGPPPGPSRAWRCVII